MPLYVADYLADTAHLSAAESGAYLHLIMHYWQKGRLPIDDQLLARVARLNDQEWIKAKPVLAEFFYGEWQHRRVEEELAKAADISAKRSAASAARKSKRSSIDEQVTDKSTSIEDTRAYVPQSQSQSQEEDKNLASLVSAESPTPATKRVEKSESSMALLDRITDLWNAWARRFGCPSVSRLTDGRATACRRRMAELAELGWGDPEAAFLVLLSRCEESFFVRGSPRKPLEFNQLMQEGFMTRMIEGSFKYQGNSAR